MVWDAAIWKCTPHAGDLGGGDRSGWAGKRREEAGTLWRRGTVWRATAAVHDVSQHSVLQEAGEVKYVRTLTHSWDFVYRWLMKRAPIGRMACRMAVRDTVVVSFASIMLVRREF